MRALVLRAAVATVLLGTVTAAFAAQPGGPDLRSGASVVSGPETLRVAYLGDNDGYALAFRPDGAQYDRWYSTGTRLLVRWSPGFATDWRADWLGEGRPRWLATAALNQIIDTPRDLALVFADELQGDRPYAGWLALSGGLDVVVHRAPLLAGAPSVRSAYAQAGLELYAGVQGPWSLAGWTQSTSHFISNGFDAAHGRFAPPRGWGHAEVRHGAALDASAFVELPLVALDTAGPGWLEGTGARPALTWSTAARADLGTTVGALALNTTLTAGLLGDPLAQADAKTPVAVAFYARGEARAVGWNQAITGPLLEGVNTAKPRRWVGELSAGVVVRVAWFELHYAQVYRTNELATLEPGLRTGQLLGQVDLALVF